MATLRRLTQKNFWIIDTIAVCFLPLQASSTTRRESGRLFNLDMIADGFAFEYTYDLPYRYQQDFKAAENDARTQERGLWSPSACAA
jgi:endonuclease YncB( thermonuclease family)